MAYRGRRYRDSEVRGIIEQYAVALEDRDTDSRGIRAIIAVADLKRAWERLRLDQQRVVLLHGILGLSQYETADALSKSKSWVQKQYSGAISDLTYIMNGDV